MRVRNEAQHGVPHRSQERRVINFLDDGISDVVALGRYEYHSVKAALSSHRHPDAVEVCYLERGRQTYQLDGRVYNLVGGHMFVVPPGALHDTGGGPEDCGILYWLILRIPEPGTSLLSLGVADTAEVMQRLLAIQRLHFVGRPVLKYIFTRLFELYDAPRDGLRSIAIKHQLLGALLEILHCAYNDLSRQLSIDISKAVEKIIGCPGADFPLVDLAKMLDLSLSRFKTKFKSEVGLAPREFILRVKVEAAKRALADGGLSVTDIAMNFGFSSSQYFATVFKRFSQQTPIEYRTAHLR
jgi:AraC-like DNA-binding protein